MFYCLWVLWRCLISHSLLSFLHVVVLKYTWDLIKAVRAIPQQQDLKHPRVTPIWYSFTLTSFPSDVAVWTLLSQSLKVLVSVVTCWLKWSWLQHRFVWSARLFYPSFLLHSFLGRFKLWTKRQKRGRLYKSIWSFCEKCHPHPRKS